MEVIKLRMSGVTEPSEEQMKDLVPTMFTGVICATFFFSFAYGVFRWIKRDEPPEASPPKP